MFQIILWLSILAVIRIIYQIIQQRRCIDDGTLRKFVSGKLRDRNEAEYRRVVAHLGLCDKCVSKLEDMNFGKNLEDHLVP